MSRYKRNTQQTPNQTPAARVPAVWPGQRRPDIPAAITIHHWGKPENHADRGAMARVVSWLCDPASRVSAHEVIQAGRVEVLAPHTAATWHAGAARANAENYALELHPRASDGDYATAAQRIADLWQKWGKVVQLDKHSDHTATSCPGRWDVPRLEAMALKISSGGSSGSSSSGSAARKSTAQLAAEVLRGDHGDGAARQRSLGSRYAAVQAEVNRQVSRSSRGSRKTDAQLAAEVLRGDHGDGAARKRSLGSRYAAVQALVNAQLGQSSGRRKSTAQLATEVIQGKHGNGAARQRSLGSRYAEVQREVNRRL